MASTSVSRADTLTLTPDYDSSGFYYGDLGNSYYWWDTLGNNHTPGASDDLNVQNYTGTVTNLYTTGTSGYSSPFTVNSLNIFDDGSGTFLLPTHPSINYTSVNLNSLFVHSGAFGIRANINVSGDSTFVGAATISSAVATLNDASMTFGGSLKIDSGASVTADALNIYETAAYVPLTVIAQNSHLRASSLNSWNLNGTLVDMAAPVFPGTTDPSVVGGSTVDIEQVSVNQGLGTMFALANGGTDPFGVYSEQTTLNVQGITSSYYFGTIVDATRGAIANIDSIYSLHTDTTAAKVSEGAQVNINRLDISGGRIGTVDGTGSTLNVGQASLTSASASGKALVVSNGGQAYFGSLGILGSEVSAIEASNSSSIDLGVDAYVQGSTGSVLDVDSSFVVADGMFVSGRNTSINIRNGSSVNFQGLGEYSGLYLSDDESLELNITGNSSVNSGNSSLGGHAGSKIFLENGSIWTGTTRTTSDPQYWYTRTVSIGGFNRGDLEADLRGTLRDMEMRATYANLTFDGATLESASVTVGEEGYALYKGGTIVRRSLTGVGQNLVAGDFGGFGHVRIEDATFYDTELYAGFGTGDRGEVILDGTNAKWRGGFAFLGSRPYWDSSTAPAGEGTLRVTNGATFWGLGVMGIGASKVQASNGTGGLNTFVSGSQGKGLLEITNGGRVALGGFESESGFFSYLIQPHTNLTIGNQGTVSIDGTSSMYVGQMTSEADATFNLGALTIGAGGTLFGNGTINGGPLSPANGSVINAGGTIAPGLSPGHLHIDGTYTQNSGDLILEVGGATTGLYDQLSATGGFTFTGGRIILRAYNGYTGAGDEGKVFDFLIGPSFDWTGFDFGTGIIDETGLGFTFGPDGGGSFGQPVPEPGSMVALGLGALAFMRRRRAHE